MKQALLTLILLFSFLVGAAAEPKEITFWITDFNQQQFDDFGRTVIDPFNSSQSAYKIKASLIQHYDRELKLALSAGKGPDVLFTEGPSYLVQYSKTGFVIPLDASPPSTVGISVSLGACLTCNDSTANCTDYQMSTRACSSTTTKPCSRRTVGRHRKLSWSCKKSPTTPRVRATRTGKEQMNIGGTQSISKFCKSPDGAAAFLDYMYQPKVFMAWTEAQPATGQLLPPGNFADSDTKSDKLDPRLVKQNEAVLACIKSGAIGYTTWTFWPDRTESVIIDGLEKVWAGQLSETDYLKGVNDQFQQDKKDGRIPPITTPQLK